MDKKMKLSAAAKYVGYNKVYMQELDRRGVLKAHRNKNNRRYYLQSELDVFLNDEHTEDEEQRHIIAYCRVSSANQRPDLKNQRSVMEDYCIAKGYSGVEYIEEIGGGLNFRRKKFCRIVSEIMSGHVSVLVVAHRDRLCRFGFELLQYIADENGTRIEVLNTEKMSPEKEMVTDLMTIVHCFSSRLYGLRNYRRSLDQALKTDTESK